MRRTYYCPFFVDELGNPRSDSKLGDTSDEFVLEADHSDFHPGTVAYQKLYWRFSLAEEASIHIYAKSKSVEHAHLACLEQVCIRAIAACKLTLSFQGLSFPFTLISEVRQIYYSSCKGCGLTFLSTPDLLIVVLPCCLRPWHRGCLKFAITKLFKVMRESKTSREFLTKQKNDISIGYSNDPDLYYVILWQLSKCIRAPKCKMPWPPAFVELFWDGNGTLQTSPKNIVGGDDWKKEILPRRAQAGLPTISDEEWAHGMFGVPKGIWFWLTSAQTQFGEWAWLRRQQINEEHSGIPSDFW